VPHNVEAIWEDHFRQPAAAYDRARDMLADPGTPLDAAAWAELTIGTPAVLLQRSGRACHWLAQAHFISSSGASGAPAR
jgi:hypothetical protein